MGLVSIYVHQVHDHGERARHWTNASAAGNDEAMSANAESASYELDITRIFDAPPGRVYQAFTDPDKLARWFGPAGWHVPRESVHIDARPGGRQRFMLVNAEDRSLSSAVDTEFIEVADGELLVGVQAAGSRPGQQDACGQMILRLEFHRETGSKTLLVLRQGPYDFDGEARAREVWNISFSRLDEVLAAA
jgi:uncharacterized protein YndB with AHSA1/START domain